MILLSLEEYRWSTEHILYLLFRPLSRHDLEVYIYIYLIYFGTKHENNSIRGDTYDHLISTKKRFEEVSYQWLHVVVDLFSLLVRSGAHEKQIKQYNHASSISFLSCLK